MSSITLFLVFFSVFLLTACGGGSSEETTNINSISEPSPPTSQTNNAPVANAGDDIYAATGQSILLHGGASYDTDNDDIWYMWRVISQPDNSLAILSDASISNPTLTLDVDGLYTLGLTVFDNELTSEEDIIVITASSENNAPTSPVNMNITDVEFQRRSGQCSDYEGMYYANVTDIQRQRDFTGDVSILAEASKCAFISNEIPNHNFNDYSAAFATQVSEQIGNYTVARNPTFASTSTPLNLTFTNAIFLNGTTLDLLAAACYGVGNEPLGREKIGCGPDNIEHPWRYDPMSKFSGFGTDQHNAHAQPDGTYHYHGNPMAMFDQHCDITGEASPVIGFAADGFPIFGSCFKDPITGIVRKATSSFVLRDNGGPRQTVNGYQTPQGGVGEVASSLYDGQFTGDYVYQSGAGDLDECNGMRIDGQYGYYITDAYPWVMHCFKGTPDASFYRQGQALENRMHSHDEGTVHSH